MGNLVPVQKALPFVPFDEMEKLAENVAKSGMFGMKTKEQALALMAIAQAEGRHPALAARDYNIIQNQPAKKPEAMMRDFIENDGKVEWHELTDTKCEATFSHPAGGTAKISWDMKRAQTAGLAGKDTWKKYPRQMLRSRVVSEGVRTVCPAATSGMYVPEEVTDFVDVKATVIEPALPIQTPEQSPAPPEPATVSSSAPVPAYDPETGEIKEDAMEAPRPRSIGVVEKNGKTNWVLFGSEFICKLQNSQTREAGEGWIKENRRLLNACKKESEKVFGRIAASVEVMRKRLPEVVDTI